MDGRKDGLNASDESLADESVILEESPCGRWSKRKKVLSHKDLVPGVDSAFLAIDAEEGVEVVWNEVMLADRQQEFAERIVSTFDQLVQLNHPNIVRFHKHWTVDGKLIFITEYITYPTLKLYLKMTKKNGKKINTATWKRFCLQLLHALRYLHSRTPCIVHGNLCSDAIYIRPNGLLKIGSVSAEAIMAYSNYKSSPCFLLAPSSGRLTTGTDIYSLGLVAFEMATLETSDTATSLPVDQIKKILDSLDNILERHFIETCLDPSLAMRPPAFELIFHPAVFNVPTLKLISAHAFIDKFANVPDLQIGDYFQLANYGESDSIKKMVQFLEDVRMGCYPIPAIGIEFRRRASSFDKTKPGVTDVYPVEKRRIEKVIVEIKNSDGGQSEILLQFIMTEKLTRKAKALLGVSDTPKSIANELLHYGIINTEDCEQVLSEIENTIKSCYQTGTKAKH
ncbi:nuclear receptor-binding protein-like isoform X1 [Artemia franciscana]|uniref:Protein kinase domain-containing protein n=1 Tax=Artemia franciscana TaxID=6661 RepID=A0AA88LB30_ARTSF|nr:hypothetical protein QYM36_006011 [Artemia franciscana]